MSKLISPVVKQRRAVQFTSAAGTVNAATGASGNTQHDARGSAAPATSQPMGISRALTILASVALFSACTQMPTAAPQTWQGFTLISPGHPDNAMLTRPYAGKNPANPNCVGDNVSPPLGWVRAPAGTKSFAIVMDDQAGRAGLGFNHWTAYGIAADATGLAEREASAGSARFVFGKNTLGAAAYLGPCPPKANAPQHYVYTLIATSLEPGALAPGLSKAELLESLRGKTLGAASLVLRFAH